MLSHSILSVKERIRLACSRIKKSADEIIIVAVSKGRTVSQIQEVFSSGIGDIGENRVQEAISKHKALAGKPLIRWHMVGHLQTNKAKDAVGIFDLIQSVDSMRLVEEIDRQAARINKVQDILLEVKTSAEEAKFGLKPDEVPEVIKEISGLKNINTKGLMTIAPLVDIPEKARPYFRQLRDLRDKINKLGIWKLGFGILSMGMSEDFEVAIEEGADMVRIGRAIFES
jgi:pyridoxal phosphate enzyme (YggS family)